MRNDDCSTADIAIHRKPEAERRMGRPVWRKQLLCTLPLHNSAKSLLACGRGDFPSPTSPPLLLPGITLEFRRWADVTNNKLQQKNYSHVDNGEAVLSTFAAALKMCSDGAFLWGVAPVFDVM